MGCRSMPEISGRAALPHCTHCILHHVECTCGAPRCGAGVGNPPHLLPTCRCAHMPAACVPTRGAPSPTPADWALAPQPRTSRDGEAKFAHVWRGGRAGRCQDRRYVRRMGPSASDLRAIPLFRGFGEPATTFYLLTAGEVVLERPDDDTFKLAPPAVIGELGALATLPRSTRARV